jgi:hypothetical protein
MIAPDTLDQILRIRRNIPKDLTGYDFLPHVISFIERGNCRVDDKTCGYYKVESRKEDDDDYYVEGELYEEEVVEAMIIDDNDVLGFDDLGIDYIPLIM